MTPDEADKVLFTMAAMWPQAKVDDATIAIWRNRLQRHEFTHVINTIDKLADQARWWPSWADVVEGVTAQKRAEHANRSALPPVPVERLPLPEVRAAIAEARAALR